MKVMFVSDTLAMGGRQRQLVELLKGLAAYPDIECHLVLLANEIFYDEIRDMPVRIHLLERQTPRDVCIFWRMAGLCRQLAPDVVQCCDRMSAFYLLPATRWLRIPLVSNIVRNACALSDLRWSWVLRFLTLPLSTVVVGNSRAGLRAWNIPEKKAVCIRNGYDMQRLDGLPPVESIREQWGIVTPYVVGMVGEFAWRKDFAGFVELAGRVLDKRKDVTFVAVGDGSLRKEVEAQVKAEHRERIRFTGACDHVEAMIQMFTICVLLPNVDEGHQEGISNAIIEYMACQKPVVARAGGGTSEIVMDGVTGFVVRAKGTSEAAEKILHLLDDPALMRRMGEAGGKRVRNEYSLETMAARFVEVFRGLCRQ